MNKLCLNGRGPAMLDSTFVLSVATLETIEE